MILSSLWIVWHCGFPIGIYDQKTAERVAAEIKSQFPLAELDVRPCTSGNGLTASEAGS